MEVYLKAFIQFEQKDLAKVSPITEFAYNDTKNISIDHLSFEVNCDYHLCTSYENNVSPYSQSKLAKEL